MRLPVLLLLLLLLLPGAALADVTLGGVRSAGLSAEAWGKGDGQGVVITGSSSTDWRFRTARSARDEVVRWSPLWQSFRFSIRDDGPRRRIAFESSFRGGTDLARGGFSAEVLTAYVDIEPTDRWGLVRIGRQIVTTAGSAGFTRMDGLRARLTLHRVGVEAFAGVPLRTRLLALQPAVEPEDPDAPLFETGWGRDFTWGVAAFLAGHAATQLRFGVQDRIRDGQLARRTLTFNGSQGIARRVLVRADFAVDLLQRRFQDVFVSVEARPVEALLVGLEYQHWEASFDATEIWSVFDTDPYDLLQGRVVLTPHAAISVWMAGGAWLYPVAITADNVPRTEVGKVAGSLRGGATLRPTDWLRVQVQERLVTGTGGGKLNVGGSVSVTPWRGRLSVTARADIQRYAFTLQPHLAGDYGSVGLQVTGRPVPWMHASVALDRIFTPWLANQIQLSASLHFLLGVRKEGRGADAASVASWEPALLAAAGMRDPRRPSSTVPGLVGGIGLGDR